MFEMFRDFLGIKNHHSYRNKIKNELKHHGNQNNKEVLRVDFRQISLTHISGAIQNYKLANDHLPEEQIVTDFCIEIGIS
jgi:hypothetical protein